MYNRLLHAAGLAIATLGAAVVFYSISYQLLLSPMIFQAVSGFHAAAVFAALWFFGLLLILGPILSWIWFAGRNVARAWSTFVMVALAGIVFLLLWLSLDIGPVSAA